MSTFFCRFTRRHDQRVKAAVYELGFVLQRRNQDKQTNSNESNLNDYNKLLLSSSCLLLTIKTVLFLLLYLFSLV